MLLKQHLGRIYIIIVIVGLKLKIYLRLVRWTFIHLTNPVQYKLLIN